MKRRDLLKVLGALPVASVLGGWDAGKSEKTPGNRQTAHTLQILLEGAFAVVLREDARLLTALVPKPDPKSPELGHYFYFNDPTNRKDPAKQQQKGYHFELGKEGLRRYRKEHADPYVNPGFSDFLAETQKWILPESLVTITLPLPRSINFTGRPLEVKFESNALKPTGLMPTNHILEYGIEDSQKIQMKCDDVEHHCATSPFCPPGIKRFYFGVRPIMNEPRDRQKHAVAFFNFLLERAFPDLRQRYGIEEIDLSEDVPESQGQPPYSSRPTNFSSVEISQMAVPAVLNSDDPKPRLLRVASMVDCQSGGILVRTNMPPG